MYFNSGEKCISGADDFEVQTPFSEDLFGSPCKNETNFIVKDIDYNTLNIEKLNESMFKNIVSPDETYSLYGISSFDDENNIYFYNISSMIGLAEIVEVNNNKYKIILFTVEDLCGLSGEDNYPLKLREWRDYLIHFNKVNNVKTLKL